ncbi:dihydroorotate dehydrogenase [Microbacteriaceae bacterium SG_E_30_P1]|uniref:Dihydroorotate dehydrogenase (quinone) n=1 Tax=Antiquaquibacter oligotrophicus TaxID=2880260 RepID=A0ABT6KLD6_9MICO|nr:quinone-dependent dihydroorotate dehydrogenase [Antiquaquibacter oligotrophicus]MDH6180832.1 dihydroorotate dehydrogenase [Antiquaquibacter oligotrophicus]UDF13452.1 quinone-dependent dihydroorotate dehydrogenase [Antiquaquibacter oligotrophicus]
MYRFLFDVVLSRLDPERAHTLAFGVIRLLPTVGLGRVIARFTRPHPSLEVRTLGLRFASPFGLAAGFDKEGTGIIGLGDLGFGHVEVGTITAIAQDGNPRPRLFRLVPDRAVINRMGFNNHGAAAARSVIEKALRTSRRPVVGINIGKSRVVDVDAATEDYLESTRTLAPLADYLVVNVSSPNTPGLRGLQELEKLTPLLQAVKDAAGRTPVLVKIAPDLSDDEVRVIAELATALVDGIIATNTTLSREGLRTDPAVVDAAGAGGLSGIPLAARSIELLRLIRSIVPEDFCVISVGGVDTADDVRERLDAGATLVQGYTAFLYRGPLWARGINRGLARSGSTRGTARA